MHQTNILRFWSSCVHKRQDKHNMNHSIRWSFQRLVLSTINHLLQSSFVNFVFNYGDYTDCKYSVKAVFALVIKFVTLVSFTYLIFRWSFQTLLYPKECVYFDPIGISQEMYHAAVCDCARIDWQCPRYQEKHSDPFGENARVETQKSFFEVQELQPEYWEYQTRNRRKQMCQACYIHSSYYSYQNLTRWIVTYSFIIYKKDVVTLASKFVPARVTIVSQKLPI